jgi:hypothetical protein
VPLEVQHKGSYGGISSSDHDQFRKDFQMIKQLLALLGGPRIFASKTQLLPLLSLFILIVAACAGGQAPEASKARSRAVIKAGDIVPAEEIRVAEYLKYYEQHFPESAVSTLGLDLRPGNVQLPVQGGTAWIQIGLQAKSDETEFVAPLNLALVIDSSGSMADHDKMPYVKESLGIFLDGLNRDDIVTIITYSDNAQLLRPAEAVGDGGWIRAVVNRISPGGSTNLHAGMMLGFREVERNFDVRRNNRVLLLTDGIANVGVTHPDRIAADALTYNDRGILLSTIGLGLEFNDDLLSQLAHQGKGGYSFVDSAKEMDRIFREHVAGLKQRAASEISLTVIPEPGVRLVSLTGSAGSLPAGGVNIPLPPMGTGDSNVVLAELRVDPSYRDGDQAIAKVELNYFDEFSQSRIRIAKMATVERTSLTEYDPVWDVAVLRNGRGSAYHRSNGSEPAV